MRVRAARFIEATVGLGILALSLTSANGAPAQTVQAGGTTLSGTVKAASGVAVSGAKVSVRNVATGQTVETQTDASGHYSVLKLTPGDYELNISAEGYSTNTMKVTMAAGARQTMDVTMGGVLSLGDLGFTPTQTQGSAQQQSLLDKRSHMLKLHQRFGLIAAAPMVATVLSSFGAGGHSSSTNGRYLHMALGAATGDLYFISAYYAIRAPKIPGTPTRGQIRWHKALAWIHGPGMILTPILGALAFNQKSNGEKVHGLAKFHGPVAVVTAAAYGAAILSVSLKF